ncbi:hypothetical protein VUR80DRAFT_7227 [Thermomyces stellatus]
MELGHKTLQWRTGSPVNMPCSVVCPPRHVQPCAARGITTGAEKNGSASFVEFPSLCTLAEISGLGREGANRASAPLRALFADSFTACPRIYDVLQPHLNDFRVKRSELEVTLHKWPLSAKSSTILCPVFPYHAPKTKAATKVPREAGCVRLDDRRFTLFVSDAEANTG